MTTAAIAGRPSRLGGDRNAFLMFIGLVWIGVLSGFGTDSFDHIRRHGLDYPLIVHLHAVTFVGWLTLFTTQAALVRNGRLDLHRRLGAGMAALAAWMLVVGPATAIVADSRRYALTGQTPEFLAVQFCDMLAFAGLTGSALLLRGRGDVHRRLMLIGLFFISDAGFARFLNTGFAAPLGQGFWADAVRLYLGSDLLVLGLGAYDLVTHRRLFPAWLAGAAATAAIQVTAITLLHDPGWKALTLRLIGH